ncbi:ORF2 [Porcine circovirus-like virus P1]|nr:ORF3 [Porcine circovirus-like virus P1]ALX87666.1 ORF2 [Porcine circovirus-like virus P1]ALX87668.1 ORF2 [Porcine circovirus-like virus P1]ALX87670.1 ORF2 [Porcine circovirus-like virus P1]ALX87672.1 ORF2 [Porcine circovirus-like virus P1]
MSTAQEGVLTVVALIVYPKVRERRVLKMPFFLLQR